MFTVAVAFAKLLSVAPSCQSRLSDRRCASARREHSRSQSVAVASLVRRGLLSLPVLFLSSSIAFPFFLSPTVTTTIVCIPGSVSSLHHGQSSKHRTMATTIANLLVDQRHRLERASLAAKRPPPSSPSPPQDVVVPAFTPCPSSAPVASSSLRELRPSLSQ